MPVGLATPNVSFCENGSEITVSFESVKRKAVTRRTRPYYRNVSTLSPAKRRLVYSESKIHSSKE